MTAADIFKSIAWEPIVSVVLKQLFTRFPVLGFGPIQWIISTLVFKFTDELYEAVRLFINLEVISFRNENFRIAFERKAVELKLVARSFGVDSEQFKEARKGFREDLKNVAHIELDRAV